MNNIDTCKYIHDNIHRLCQNEIDEIFKILHKNDCSYTQNNNGVFVNLNWLDEDILNNIKDYVSFCLCSQREITKYESIKNTLSNKLATKEKIIENDEDALSSINQTIISTKNSKISSSMKFYLLKKRFQKKSCPIAYNNNVLTHEEYIM